MAEEKPKGLLKRVWDACTNRRALGIVVGGFVILGVIQGITGRPVMTSIVDAVVKVLG